MMNWYWGLMIFLAAGIGVVFGYMLGSIMTTAKFADKQAEQLHKENEKDV